MYIITCSDGRAPDMTNTSAVYGKAGQAPRSRTPGTSIPTDRRTPQGWKARRASVDERGDGAGIKIHLQLVHGGRQALTRAAMGTAGRPERPPGANSRNSRKRPASNRRRPRVRLLPRTDPSIG